MFTFPRHCERSKAIQSGLPRRLRLLAMTVSVFVISSPAFACKRLPFEMRLEKADLVFEGHLISYEKTKTSYGFGLIKNYEVDKSWKNVKKDQIIKIHNHFGVKSIDDIPKIPEQTVTELFALRLVDNKDGVFHSCSQSNSLTPENIKFLSQEFPQAAQ